MGLRESRRDLSRGLQKGFVIVVYMIKAKVYITLKKGVLDTQGKTVKSALDSMGYKEVIDLRIGKFMEMELEVDSKDMAEKRLNEMCEKLLANPVIEDYRFEIEDI